MIMIDIFDWVEKIVGKGENAVDLHSHKGFNPIPHNAAF